MNAATLDSPQDALVSAPQPKPAILITGADLADEALALLTGYRVAYAGKTPSEQYIVDLCRYHNPVAIIAPSNAIKRCRWRRNMKAIPPGTVAQLPLFEDQTIHRGMHEGAWYWSITDIIDALTDGI